MIKNVSDIARAAAGVSAIRLMAQKDTGTRIILMDVLKRVPLLFVRRGHAKILKLHARLGPIVKSAGNIENLIGSVKGFI